MHHLVEKSLCCGCGTCALVCPVSSISMVEDDAGFVIPRVDEVSCVNCGKCAVVCPVLHHENEEDTDHDVYAAYAKDEQTRFSGSSGGMFGIFARDVIGRGGIVYGAAFDEELKLTCVGAETLQELQPLCKSKYLQCDMGDSFFRVRTALEQGREVLFVSTPCCVYGLRRFLDKEYENLTTVDFVCHGVPSQSFFDQCKAYVEKRDGIKLLNYQFRAKKKKGATPHYYKIKYLTQRGASKESAPRLYTKSPFYLAFQKYISLRDSCYDCHFSCSNRCSDITIGDFHNIDRYMSGIDRFQGVSTVVVNTEKGAALWRNVCEKIKHWQMDFKQLIANAELMCGPTPKPQMRDVFIQDLKTLSFDAVVKKHMNSEKEWKKDIYYVLPRSLRNLMKKAMGIK